MRMCLYAGKEIPQVQSQSGAKKRSNESRTKQPRAKRSRSEGNKVVDLESLYHVYNHQAGITAGPATKFPMHRSSVDSGTE